ncbi:MAG: hypothetical protein FD189_1086 [Elusimicrobia bacterium]|nr:MAG: hypothetical protein FD189_1086 [Elusimicrobiota bacterium]
MTPKNPGRPSGARGECGVALQRAREAAGLTQAQAARRIGVHPKTYQAWETRRPPRPNVYRDALARLTEKVG